MVKMENKARKVVLCQGDNEHFIQALNDLLESGHYVRYESMQMSCNENGCSFAVLLVEPKKEGE